MSFGSKGVTSAMGAIVLAGACRPALAGPPLITDDPDPVDKGHWEINIPYTLDLSHPDADGKRTWTHEAPLLDINYGAFEGMHVKLEVPTPLIIDEPGQGPRAGIGDASLGTKIRLINEEKDGTPFSLSIFPALGIPTGDSGRGLGTGSPSILLPVQVGRRFFDDKLFLYGDLGYKEQFDRSQPDTWQVGIAAEAEVVEGFTLCAELRYEYGLRGAPDDALWQLGVKYQLSEHVGLMGAAGRSFDPDVDSGSDLLVYIGVQLSF